MSTLAHSIAEVEERISAACFRTGRAREEILLIAVTKTVPAKLIQEAINAGLIHFGENYIQEAQGKIETISQGTWHFIGHLQKNKARQAVKLFALIETVDSVSLAEELNRQAEKAEKTVDVLLQVNEAGEASKSGLSPDQVPLLLEQSPVWPFLHIRGFMSIPPYDPNPEKSRPWYHSLHQWRDKWQLQFSGIDLGHLSMGMSHDFEVAIEEGATIIRVGTALFGPRE
jgi:PLP dependent protein